MAHVPELAVVVLSHNRRETLGQHLRLLLDAETDGDVEYVVVDNGSQDGSVDDEVDLSARYTCLRAILLPSNDGVAAGRTVGMEASSAPIILSLDDDALLNPASWRHHLACFNSDATLGVLVPPVVHGVSGENQGYIGRSGDEVANFHGAGHFIRRADEVRNTEISVGNGCWIGARSTILGGLHVGDGSVVGACSLVNRDVKPNSLVGGVGDVVEGLRMAGRGEPAGRSFARMPRRCDDQPRVVTHSRGPLPRTSVVGTHSLRESS